MAKYKAGDKVRIRKDLKRGGGFDIWVSDKMEKMAGKIVEIDCHLGRHDEFDKYRIKEDKGGWDWTEDMFEPVHIELKVGDMVRVRPDLKADSREYDDCLTTECMVKFAGKIVTIKTIECENRYTIEESGNGFHWSSEMFILDGSGEVDPPKREDKWKIIITSDGKKTTAVYRDGENTREAFCRCSPNDTFDFEEGARIAFSRLWEDDDEDDDEDDLGYEGKVICVQRGYAASAPVDNFTVGKIYTVTDGHIKGDKMESAGKYYSLEMLCLGMGHKFIPLVE